MTNLQYIASFSFTICLSSHKTGKESIFQELMSLTKRQKENSIYPNIWRRIINSNGDVVLEYDETLFANLSFKNSFVISDGIITFLYEERTNQQIMLPNIFGYVYMLLVAIKVAERINGGFDKNSVTCRIQLENNSDCYFYEKYSPLAVDYSRILKYCLDRSVDFEIMLKKKGDVYLLVNSIYQQYKSDESMEKPYVTVIKDSFNQLYNEI